MLMNKPMTKAGKYRKVQIYCEREYMVNLHELKNGKLVERKPHVTRWYKYADGAREYTKEEVKESIDWCLAEAEKRNLPGMVDTLNEWT